MFYLYTKHPLIIQKEEELEILGNLYKFPEGIITLNEKNKIPDASFPRNFSMMKAIELILNNPSIGNLQLDKKIILKETKSVIIKSIKFLNNDNLLLLKTLKGEVTLEFIHSAFVGLACINNLSKKIPNFMYTFSLKNNDMILENSLINEKSITFNEWLIDKDRFNVNQYILILIQITLALHVAQKECSFVHYDLFPWNIIIVSLEEEQDIEYQISAKKICFSLRQILYLL